MGIPRWVLQRGHSNVGISTWVFHHEYSSMGILTSESKMGTSTWAFQHWYSYSNMGIPTWIFEHGHSNIGIPRWMFQDLYFNLSNKAWETVFRNRLVMAQGILAQSKEGLVLLWTSLNCAHAYRYHSSLISISGANYGLLCETPLLWWWLWPSRPHAGWLRDMSSWLLTRNPMLRSKISKLKPGEKQQEKLT